jgi:hypothetical protein
LLDLENSSCVSSSSWSSTRARERKDHERGRFCRVGLGFDVKTEVVVRLPSFFAQTLFFLVCAVKKFLIHNFVRFNFSLILRIFVEKSDIISEKIKRGVGV